MNEFCYVLRSQPNESASLGTLKIDTLIYNQNI